MRFFLATLFAWLAIANCVRAEWKVAQAACENSPNESIAHWQTIAEDPANDARAELHFAVFAINAVTLRVIDQPNESPADLATTMTRLHALAGVNGGYFDPENAPVGLLVSGGRKISPTSSARLLGGVLWASATRIDITRATHFKMSGAIKNAVQCGPLLVERGEPIAGLNDTRAARRTFAAVDGRGHVALGVSSCVSLGQLAQILRLTNLAGTRSFVRALNLDGGSSSAFWLDGFSIPEHKPVRDFVALFPRASR